MMTKGTVNTMKRFICAVLAAVSVFAFSACNKNDTVKNDGNENSIKVSSSVEDEKKLSAGETKSDEQIAEEREEIPVPTTLSNTYYRLTHDKELNVAYLGGSITQGSGASKYANNWVALTTAWLSEKFPDATINENNAGISNTGSNYGIFRLQHDIFDVAVPDLMFIEYTSNDWGRFGDLNISRQNESIIRMLYEKNPKMDIVFLFTNFGYDSPCRRASTALAEHYGLMVIDPGSDLKTLIDTQEGGVYDRYSPDKIHPSDEGHAYYLKLIEEQFTKYLIEQAPKDAAYLDFVVPEPLNENGLFLNPEIIEPVMMDIPDDFEYKSMKVAMKNRVYDHMISTEKEGAEYEFEFEGTGFGLLVYKTPTVSNIRYSVDGGEFVDYAIGDMHNYNHGQMYIMEYDLEPGKHTVKVQNVVSQYGTKLNIMGICVNK